MKHKKEPPIRYRETTNITQHPVLKNALLRYLQKQNKTITAYFEERAFKEMKRLGVLTKAEIEVIEESRGPRRP